MAEFLFLALRDDDLSFEEIDQVAGSFVLACELSCDEESLGEVMRADLSIAGFDQDASEEIARSMLRPGYQKHVSTLQFIHRNLPEYGLLKKSEIARDVNIPRFIGKIIELADR
jgi:hypothetical protein